MPLASILNETTTTLSAEDEYLLIKQEKAHREIMFFLPFCIILLIFMLSYLFYSLMKKRRLDQLRHQLVPLYNFEPGEGDDWETEVLDPHLDDKLPKKQHDYHTIDMRKNS